MSDFRKSDAKRTALPDFLQPSDHPELVPLPQSPSLSSIHTSPTASRLVQSSLSPVRSQALNFLPGLPPIGDFRTSLILPDLSRRFTLLRKPSGDPVTLDDLRDKFAEQRAKGAENSISEEEEDMILETLGRIRAKNAGVKGGGSEGLGSPTSSQVSIQMSKTLAQVSPTGNRSKRYSNNLFGSGRFRDYSYVRSATQQKKGTTTPTGSVTRGTSIASLESDIANPYLLTTAETTEQQVPSSVYTDNAPMSVAEHRMSKLMNPSAFKRASMALEEAMNQIEEEPDEEEEEIVMPRLTQSSRLSHNAPHSDVDSINIDQEFETGTAMTSDNQITPDSVHRASPVKNGPESSSPTPRLPGYIPGMPRPMTPRDIESEEQRSHSTTPRATSPNSHSDSIHSNVPSLHARRFSDASASHQSPLPVSLPVSPSASSFIQRSANGRFTPEDRSVSPVDADSSISPSILSNRRRPSSPLSGSAFQSMAISSRPGTPSNVIWTVPNSSPQKTSTQVKDGSSAGEQVSTGPEVPASDLPEKANSNTTHPAPSESAADVNSSTMRASSPNENQVSPAISRVEAGSPTPMAGRLRSPTPTQTMPKSPASSTFADHDSSIRGNVHSRRASTQSDIFTTALSLPRSALVFSPMANSSRSSLESEGSSYHSWDAGRKGHDLFHDLGDHSSLWHDVPFGTEKSSLPASEEADEAEEVIGRYAGLTTNDFLSIQEKLVGAATAKVSTPPVRDRVPSLRRRRPSTSQSNYSFTGNDSKAQNSSNFELRPRHHVNSSKASALLESVVDSIESSRTPTASPSPEESKKLSVSEIEFSSSFRRHKDLADALFGPQETGPKHSSPNSSISLPPATPPTAVSPIAFDQLLPVVLPSHAASTPLSRQLQQPKPPPPVTGQKPSLTKISKVTEADLAKEIVRKTEAAMVELGKHPESFASQDALRVGGLAGRKRINPSQISQPRLVSASTSVDTIPLQSTIQPPKKISDRLKKIRETLRSKHPSGSNGEEITPYPLNTELAASGIVRRGSGSSAFAGTESGGSRVSLTTPPASSAPSLKGFLGRWRRPRTANGPVDADLRPSPLSQTGPPSASSSQPYFRSSLDQSQSAPPATRMFNLPASRRTMTPDTGYGDENSQTETEDTVARKRFLDAASSLGLDEDAVQDLLSRKGSSRNNSNPFVARPLAVGVNRSQSARLPVGNGNAPLSSVNARNQYIAESHVPERPNGRSSLENVRNDEAATGKKPPMRRRADPQDGNNSETAIVRRTLIFPSEATSTIDLNFLRKGSQAKRRRSGSGGSLRSSRSVHDRAPTPPPPRSPTSPRFSRDSPPVPRLPPTFASYAENMLHVPISAPSPLPIEKTSSTYDSLFEMYAEEGRSVASNDPDKLLPPQHLSPDQPGQSSDSGPALELIEMANGELIWSIVNGLRDDDAESTYQNRVSFASEYSVQEASGEGLQVLFKERSNAESRNSFTPPKALVNGKARPETKVFYISSANIGQLIENLSRDNEGGTINFSSPGTPVRRSNPSLSSESGNHWTVEETLDHMLKSMSR